MIRDLVPFAPSIRVDESWRPYALNIQPLNKEAQLNQLQYYRDDAETLAKSIIWWMIKFYGRELLPYTFPDIPNDSLEFQ